MGGPVVISAIVHGLAMVLLYIGLPHLSREEQVREQVVVVELVAVDENRNLPNEVAQKTRDTDIEDVRSELPPPPPPPPTSSSTANLSEKVSAPLNMQLPPSKPVSAAAQRQETEVIKETIVPDYVKTPVDKPLRPDPFASVLKSIEDLEINREQSPDKEKPEPKKLAQDPLEQVLAMADKETKSNIPLSMTELDNIRYQIQRNWNLPAGGRNVHNMQVALRIKLGPDGQVLDVSVLDNRQMAKDPFFRAMAESAVRAVLKTGQIKNLSPSKYHLWRDMKINFDPKEMFG